MSNVIDINALFGNAVEDGSMSSSSLSNLSAHDFGPQIQAGLGTTPQSMSGSSDAFHMIVVIDDSGSIFSNGNADNVINGVNTLLDAVLNSKQRNNILVSLVTVNGHVLYPFTPLTPDIRLTRSNYKDGGYTPLFYQSMVSLTTLFAKIKEFEECGVISKTLAVVFTDGENYVPSYDKKNVGADAVASIVNDLNGMNPTEVEAPRVNTVLFVGIDDGHTDFRAVARSMGITQVLTPGNTQSEIRKAFNLASQSAVSAMTGVPVSNVSQSAFLS